MGGPRARGIGIRLKARIIDEESGRTELTTHEPRFRDSDGTPYAPTGRWLKKVMNEFRSGKEVFIKPEFVEKWSIGSHLEDIVARNEKHVKILFDVEDVKSIMDSLNISEYETVDSLKQKIVANCKAARP